MSSVSLEGQQLPNSLLCQLPPPHTGDTHKTNPMGAKSTGSTQAHTCLIILAALCLRVPVPKQDMDVYGIQVIHPRECPPPTLA